MMYPINEMLLEQKLEELESAGQWGPRVISKLENLLGSDDDFDLFRINPIRYAIERNMDERESIDLFLHAVKVGLFEMHWNMVCGSCASVFGSFEHLTAVQTQFNCPVCKNENTSSLDDLIHVTFGVSPQIRDLVYNHPNELSAEDYYFKYFLVEGAIFPPDSYFVDLVKQFTRHIEFINPTESKNYKLDLEPGFLIVRNVNSEAAAMIAIAPAGPDETTQQLSLEFGDNSLKSNNTQMQAGTITFGELAFLADLTGEVKAGTLDLQIQNTRDERSALLVLVLPPVEPKALTFESFLSGKNLLSHQTFRDLFRSETIGADEGIAVKDMTLLFTDLTGSTALYDQVGDPQAFFVVQQHFATLKEAIVKSNGAIVKTIGDAVMATFDNPADAVEAALASLAAIDSFNKTISEDIVIKIGVHRGHCIAVNSNDQQDYFGQTVNIAARVQGLAGPREIFLSQSAYESADVQAQLQEHTVERKEVSVKGIANALQVYQVSKGG